MKRILGPAILALMLSATVMTAQNAQTFYLVTAARAGNVKLPRNMRSDLEHALRIASAVEHQDGRPEDSQGSRTGGHHTVEGTLHGLQNWPDYGANSLSE
jgi:hypothetical protein